MKTPASLILIFIISSLPCFARLGETEDQCVARYGLETVLQLASRAKLTEFEKDDFKLQVVFWDGKAVFIVFRKTSGGTFSKEEVYDIVAKNADPEGWSDPTEVSLVDVGGGVSTVWVGKADKKRRAQWSHDDNDLTLLCKGNDEALEALQQAKAAKSTNGL